MEQHQLLNEGRFFKKESKPKIVDMYSYTSAILDKTNEANFAFQLTRMVRRKQKSERDLKLVTQKFQKRRTSINMQTKVIFEVTVCRHVRKHIPFKNRLICSLKKGPQSSPLKGFAVLTGTTAFTFQLTCTQPPMNPTGRMAQENPRTYYN